MEAEKGKLKGVCPKCQADIYTLDVKVDAVKTYSWNPTTNKLTETNNEEGIPFNYLCPACGEEIAANWDKANEIFE